MTPPKVSNCCGKHGFVEVFDGRLSGTNYVDAEDLGICPKCKEHCEFINQKIKTMTSTFKIEKKIEHEINIQVPSFWKKHSRIIGILDTDSVFTVLHLESYSSMSVQALDQKVAEDIQTATEITEEEFFAEYNKAYDAMRLKPELRSDDYTSLLNKVVNQTY